MLRASQCISLENVVMEAWKEYSAMDLMGEKESLKDKYYVVSSKEDGVDCGDKVDGLLRKKRRPWRNKVRKKAAKESKRKLREEGSDVQVNKKKKKIKIKKCLSENEAMNREGMSSVKGMDSSLFRYINEQLYTMNGAAAMELFRNEPQTFELYHKGYQKQ
ncbi:unnamed protein product, partial [Litomosoides sigmodontis]